MYRQNVGNMVLFIGEIELNFNLLLPFFDPFDVVGDVSSGSRTTSLVAPLKCDSLTDELTGTAVVTFIMNERYTSSSPRRPVLLPRR